jgi:UDP-N-acetylglucosamine acyltransferase
MKIAQLAFVHPGAQIGSNVVVEEFTKIDKDVVIGDGCWIGSNAVIMPGARIGKNCNIFPGAIIAAKPQDMKFRGEYSTVEIGDNTTIREYATINRGTVTKGITHIGSNSLIMAYVHIGHDTVIGNNCVIVNSVQIAGEVIVEDWVTIGGMSAVHQFCRIGAHAMVSGMTGVVADVAPYTKVFGVPAKYVGINIIGLKRHGFSSQQIEHIHNIYRILFQQGMNISQAIEFIEFNFDNTFEKTHIIQFLRQTSRGISRANGNMHQSQDVEIERNPFG